MQSVGPESTVARRLGVPFLDLGRLHRDLKSDVLAAVSELVDSSAFTNGPQVRQFEQAFAAWCGASRCVGTASGLDALRLALLAAGIERGDEVVVPANTFVATFEAVTQAGGRPVPADVTEEKAGPSTVLRLKLKYVDGKVPVVSGLKRISKPGLRVYAGKTDIPRVLGGLGIVSVSTSQGIMTGQQARKAQLGGEVLAYVW